MAKKVAIITSVHDVRDPRISLKVARTLSRKYQTHLIGGFNDNKAKANAFRSDFVHNYEWHPLDRMLGYADRLERQILIYQLLKHIKPDVYYLNDPELLPLAVIIRNAQGGKIIMDLHEDYFDSSFDPMPLNSIQKRFVHYSYNHADAIVTAFELDQRIYHPRPEIPHIELLNLYPYSLNQTTAEKPTPATNEVIISFTGTIHKTRGMHNLLEFTQALHSLNIPVKTHIAGKCFVASHWQWLQNEISERKLSDQFVLEGGSDFVNWFRIQQLQQQATFGFLIYPLQSFNWQFPTKCYEFAANRLHYLFSPFPSFQKFNQLYGGGIEISLDDDTYPNSILSWLENPKTLYRERTPPSWESQEEQLFELIEIITS